MEKNITVIDSKKLIKINQKTPIKHVKIRVGKGGMNFKYVTTSYVQKMLNDTFNWYWSFEIKEHGLSPDKKAVWVLGKLVILNPMTMQPAITKEQFGRKDIAIMRKDGSIVDFGNDLKAASSDALKKCASLIGICADIYADEDTASDINSEYDEIMQKEIDVYLDDIKKIKNEKELQEFCKNLKDKLGKEFARFIIPAYQEQLKAIKGKNENTSSKAKN